MMAYHHRKSEMITMHTVDQLAQRLAALVPPGFDQVRSDLGATFRSTLQAGLRELDLVSREEFDVQRCVLLRTREKLEELEQQILALERSTAGAVPAQQDAPADRAR
jgi:BMFP domain-containing protein YqiC